MTPALVLLPGLDGSGELFAPLLEALGGELNSHVLKLPTDGSQTQRDLAAHLLPQLPDAPFVLLAESFSGAIAVEIARLRPPGLVHVILVATFLESPRPFLLGLPPWLFRVGWQLRRPLATFWWPFCGYRGDGALRQAVLDVLGQLPWPTLLARLQAIRSLQSHEADLSCAVSIFHAENDWLVPKKIGARMQRLGNARALKGPHFLLQSEPVMLASHIKTILRTTATSISHPA